jgi:CHAT domain-containing protein
LTGTEAGESQVKELAPQAQVLHLATHGFFLSDSCRAGSERLRGMGGTATIPAVASGPPSDALLLSGLVLAGANLRRSSNGPEDGILTAEEISLLDLSGLEWAVLSACDTGVGAIRPGEGILGLRRAFHVAGARSLVMSLWAVPDEATQQWMELLYRARFERRLSTVESARQATREALANRRSRGESTLPCYWAGFVAEGQWR